MNLVKKIKIVINNPDKEIRKSQYKFIRDSQYAQCQGLNRCMSYLISGYYLNNMDLNSEKFKEHQRSLTNSSNIFRGINLGKGIDSKSNIHQRVMKDFRNVIKNGLANGERNVINYRRTFPLITRGRNLNFFYDENEKDILIDWVNKVQFKCILGEYKNQSEVKNILDKVISKEYGVAQCSMYFNKKNELMLMLTLKIEQKEEEFKPVKNRQLEIIFGEKVPIYMLISDKPYIKKSLGDSLEFTKMRAQFRARKIRLDKQLKFSKGGKGKKDKLKAIEEFREKQRNFIKTYNHFLSKNIIEFALKHKCEYICLENLDKGMKSNLLLSNWGYYELKEKLLYKAAMKGIVVKDIDSIDTCN